MPEQRKRFYCVAEITLSTTFLIAPEVPAIAAFVRSGLQERSSKTPLVVPVFCLFHAVDQTNLDTFL